MLKHNINAFIVDTKYINIIGVILLVPTDFTLFNSYLQQLSTVRYHQESNSLSSFDYASQNHNV